MYDKLIFLLTALIFLGSCSQKENIIDSPNFVFILADDLGYGELGILGQNLIETPNIDQLAREGMILTDNNNETSEKGIFAIGDLTGAPWLAHKASHEGINAVDYISNPNRSNKHNKIIPGCTYSRPQIASIGLTEEKAIAKGIKIKKGKFPLLGNGKALSLGYSDGFTKTIFNAETGELIGAHMIGPEVTELISTYCVAMQLEATELDLFNTIFPHPTISESIHESVLDAYDRAIHI